MSVVSPILVRLIFCYCGFTLLLWPSTLLAAGQTLADEPTLTEQQAQPDPLLQPIEFPPEYQQFPYAQRLDWLAQQLADSEDPVRRYQLQREQGFQHYAHYATDALLQSCQQQPPQASDLDYRYICASSVVTNDEPSIRPLLKLYEDATQANNINLAVQALSAAAWKQSANGNIAGAFRSYELALSQLSQVKPSTLNDVMLNTAVLYVMHGDAEFVKKGVQLQQQTIASFEAQRDQQSKPGGDPAQRDYANEMIAITQYNIGVAYTLHLHDYPQALQWFKQVSPDYKGLHSAALVFAALAAAELQQHELAGTLIAQALPALANSTSNPNTAVEAAYIACYLQLIQQKLGRSAALHPCQQLPDTTPLEVSLDIYKRMAVLGQADWRLLGLEQLHQLFINKLEHQLKQSASQAASHAELSRLQVESELKTVLLAQEKSLKIAEQQQHQSQLLLTAAAIAILLLVVLMVTIQLRHKAKLARQYKSLSVLDGLTGLHNRRYFEQHIGRELQVIRRSQQMGSKVQLAFFLLDIDHFKKINDHYGHDAGDEVLVEFSRRLKTTVRETDLLVRWGGEEFLLVARIEPALEQHQLAERIRTLIADQPFKIAAQQSLAVSCTIGGIVCPPATKEPFSWQQLVQLADAALYLGKRKQRNCWVCIDQIADTSVIEQLLQQELEVSAQHGQLQLSGSCLKTEPHH